MSALKGRGIVTCRIIYLDKALLIRNYVIFARSLLIWWRPIEIEPTGLYATLLGSNLSGQGVVGSKLCYS